MMNQILGLRPYFNEREQKQDVTDNTFFKRGWGAESIRSLFQNLDENLAKIPEKERWNMFYTVAACAGKREFVSQDTLIFDVDKITPEDLMRFGVRGYAEKICLALEVPIEFVAIVGSGNGVHVLIHLLDAIRGSEFFDLHRRHYKALVEKIDAELLRSGMSGAADPAVFDPRRIMRLPGTINRKKDKADKPCTLVQLPADWQAIDFDLKKRSGIPEVEASDQINKDEFKRYGTADAPAVLEGCEFLKHCAGAPDKISEAEWYGMLSIVARMENGHTIAHDLSRGHPKYSANETDSKIQQALEASGPRTCTNINKLWSRCHTCKYNGKVNSPIMIRGPKYIATQSTGFYTTVVDEKSGKIKRVKPNFEDLRRYFEQKFQYVVLGDSRMCFVWTGTHWSEMKDAYIENFAQAHFSSFKDDVKDATTAMVQEFRSLVCRTNLRDPHWFTDTTGGKMNFSNGVLDLHTMELKPHSIDYGFRYVLKYAYDPLAKAPEFERFMLDVMGGDEKLVKVLLEFSGYSYSNDSCWAQKALIMTGHGSNGKSVFMNILRELSGKSNYASLTLGDLKADTNRQQLDGRLFNLAEETPSYAMAESSLFKNLVTGGDTVGKLLYKQPYTFANKCKLMFSANDLPRTKDVSYGYFRRLIIVPFNQAYTDENGKKDAFIEEKLIKELPGIFNLVIEGYHRLRKQRAFTGADAIKKQIEQYKLELDTVAVWVKDCVELVADESLVAQSKLYSSYSFFCTKRGEKPEVYTTFCKRLKTAIPDYDTRIGARKLIDGVKERQLRGIRFGDQANF